MLGSKVRQAVRQHIDSVVFDFYILQICFADRFADFAVLIADRFADTAVLIGIGRSTKSIAFAKQINFYF